MKVVLLHPTVKGLIDELRKLPSNHTPPEGAPIKQCICPYEEAKRICSRHLKKLMDDNPIHRLIHMGVFLQVIRILHSINSQYDDGRTCPWESVYYTLKGFYEPTKGKLHPWFTQSYQVRQLMEMGLIELDGNEYELISSQPQNHELSSMN